MLVNKALVSKKLDFLNNQICKIGNMDFSEEAFVQEADVPQKETAKDAFKFLGKQR